MKSILLLCVLAAALPATAMAQEARSTKWVNLRAGPARDYPLVARLGPGTPLAVQGCTNGFGWCDVVAPGNVRGWIYAGNIAYPYQNAEVPVLRYGALIGFPIIGFMIGDYWGQYYRNRPWYGNEARWRNRPPAFSPRGFPPGRGSPGMAPRPGQHPPGLRPPGGERHPGGAGRPGDNRPRGANRPTGGRPTGGNRPSAGDRPAGGNRPSGGGGRAGGERARGGARPPGGNRPGGAGRPGGHGP